MARQKLDRFIHPDLKVIYLSGSPSIESHAQLFYQLSISPRHSFSLYKKKGNSYPFHHFYNGRKNCTLPSYGLGITKRIGYNKETIDYSAVKPFPEKYEPIMIKRAEEDSVKIVLRHIEEPETIKTMKHLIKTEGAIEGEYETLADGGASKLTKQHQLSGGTLITENGPTIVDEYRAIYTHTHFKNENCCIFYKYQKEKELLSKYFNPTDLYPVDSNVLGVDLSHYDSMVVYSLPWSGQNYLQMLSRLVNIHREDRPTVYILIADYPDIEIYQSVSNKRDFNQSMLTD